METLGMFIRLLFSLGVVIGLMWAAAHFVKRRGLAPMGGSRRNGSGVQVEMLARKSLGKNSAIAVIRVGERSMIVGITDHQVNKLDDADIEQIDLNDAGATWTAPSGGPPTMATPSSAWKAMLDQMRARTVRR
jgi:flagellar protein FliO/FliZ